MSQNQPTKQEQGAKPPYVSYKTFRNFLDGLRANGIPGRIDRSVMPTSMSGANQVIVVAALKYLGLINEMGIPQDNLVRIVELDGPERAQAYQEVLRSRYTFLFNNLDIERATTRQVEERFRESGLQGDTVRKGVSFFLLAAKDAEMKISPHIKPYQGGRNGGGQRQRSRASARGEDEAPGRESQRGQADPPPPPPPEPNKSPYQILIEILSPDMQDEEQNAVWTLIRYLKKKEAEVKQ